MKAYVSHMTVGEAAGWYVLLTVNGEEYDIAGPFDDELDAELMARRALELAS